MPGILARRHLPETWRIARRHPAHDLVVVNLYPFAGRRNPATGFDALIEEIDIGGPSMVRAAAKLRDVLIVVDPRDTARPRDLAAPGGSSPAFRFERRARVRAHAPTTPPCPTSRRSATTPIRSQTGECPALPATMRLSLPQRRVLRYGENPHQQAAWYAIAPAQGFSAVEIRQGKELSYTNLLDLDAAARIALEFDEPAAAVIKHANPCGVATATTIALAYLTARDADALSAFGGIIGLNRTLDVATAQAIVTTFIEAVVAPAVDEAALPICGEEEPAGDSPPTSRRSATRPGPASSCRSILARARAGARSRGGSAQSLA